MVKYLYTSFLLSVLTLALFAQKRGTATDSKKEDRFEKRSRINEMIRHEEEGVPAFQKQSVLSIKVHHDGYGFIYEKGKSTSAYKSSIFQIEFAEKQHPKEQKQSSTSFSNTGFALFGRPFIYGKQNIFYQTKFGLGQQIMIAGKGNKNGVAVFATFVGGASLGIERPYYMEYNTGNGTSKINFTEENRNLFLNPQLIIGGTGLQMGWNQLKFNPGAYAKAGLRFDWARFNHQVSALEFGFGFDYFTKQVVQMVDVEGRSFFPTGYIGLVFGNRK
jgi:hypothetical protein